MNFTCFEATTYKNTAFSHSECKNDVFSYGFGFKTFGNAMFLYVFDSTRWKFIEKLQLFLSSNICLFCFFYFVPWFTTRKAHKGNQFVILHKRNPFVILHKRNPFVILHKRKQCVIHYKRIPFVIRHKRNQFVIRPKDCNL